jgi:hypothetical protein
MRPTDLPIRLLCYRFVIEPYPASVQRKFSSSPDLPAIYLLRHWNMYLRQPPRWPELHHWWIWPMRRRTVLVRFLQTSSAKQRRWLHFISWRVPKGCVPEHCMRFCRRFLFGQLRLLYRCHWNLCERHLPPLFVQVRRMHVDSSKCWPGLRRRLSMRSRPV